MYCIKRKIFFCLFLISLSCLFSCVSNLTLEQFDLGNGRQVKVVTGSPDSLLPIYYEMYIDNVMVQQCFISQESTNYNDVKKLRFKVFSDKSKNIFALMQESPETDFLAMFDFSTKFRYPCCSNDYGVECLSKYNQLGEILERDNPELKITRAEIP